MKHAWGKLQTLGEVQAEILAQHPRLAPFLAALQLCDALQKAAEKRPASPPAEEAGIIHDLLGNLTEVVSRVYGPPPALSNEGSSESAPSPDAPQPTGC